MVLLYYVVDRELWWPVKIQLVTAIAFAGRWVMFEIMMQTRLRPLVAVTMAKWDVHYHIANLTHILKGP
jgi:hypothetical protein